MNVKRILIISGSIIITIISIILITTYNRNKQIDSLVLNQIESIKELVTAKQIYKEILYSKETKDFLWLPLSNKEFLFSVEYIVTAGVDLSKGYQIKTKKDLISITLPKAEIISIDADDESIKEYFVKKRFSDLYRDDYFKLIQDNKKRLLKSNSIELLLTESEENAADILGTLLQLSGLPVEINFSNSISGALK